MQISMILNITKLNGENIKINNMKNLNEYLIESILDIDDNIDNVSRSLVVNFLKDNYKGSFVISNKPNKDGKYEVSGSKDIEVINTNITSLTNASFIWAEVDGNFICNDCNSLTSLAGAPRKVGGHFCCVRCESLISLEGAPKEVEYFTCNACKSLMSLKGSPKKVNEDFFCVECASLKSLKGAPEKVGGIFVVVGVIL